MIAILIVTVVVVVIVVASSSKSPNPKPWTVIAKCATNKEETQNSFPVLY